MPLNQSDLVKLYRGLAGSYDLTTNLYRVLGFPMGAFRKAAVKALALRPGDIVVELACGTGLNFPLLQQAIGPSGKIIGVDMTDAMLARARERIQRHGWRNVELVHSDVTQYEFKTRVDGIQSTFAMHFVAEYDHLIQRCSEALNPGKRLAIADLKPPDGRLARLAPLLSTLARPYGTTMDLADRRPWESVVHHLDDATIREFYFGYAYLASGQRNREPASTKNGGAPSKLRLGGIPRTPACPFVPSSRMSPMNRHAKHLVLFFAAILATTLAQAQSAEEQAVLAPIHAMFDGMSKRDAAVIKAPTLPGGVMVLMRDGKPAQMTFEAFAERVGKPSTTQSPAQPPAQIEERIHDPLVRIDNDLAVVWAPFDFLVNGKVDHCGTDLFNMVRVDGKWLIAGVADTGTKTCPAK